MSVTGPEWSEFVPGPVVTSMQAYMGEEAGTKGVNTVKQQVQAGFNGNRNYNSDLEVVTAELRLATDPAVQRSLGFVSVRDMYND